MKSLVAGRWSLVAVIALIVSIHSPSRVFADDPVVKATVVGSGSSTSTWNNNGWICIREISTVVSPLPNGGSQSLTIQAKPPLTDVTFTYWGWPPGTYTVTITLEWYNPATQRFANFTEVRTIVVS